jgi:uncharacterized membrane-anchored protein
MNISADQVQKSCVGTQIIEQEINTIFKTFQSEILEASKNGCTRVVVEVPTNFNIVGMSNQTAQTVIYHRLIKECEDKGFSVKLSLDSSAVTYCIQWNINKNSKDLTHMRDVIATHVVGKKEDAGGAEQK